MRLFEFEAKRILKAEGIAVPRGEVVSSYGEAKRAAMSLRMPVVLKAQVLTGGRGKAGGVRVAEDPEQAAKLAQEILGMRIDGSEVERLLVEEYLASARELFLSVTIDDSKGRPVILACSEGGIEIEDLAAKFPEKIVSVEVDPLSRFEPYRARRIAGQVGLRGDLMINVGNLIWLLYRLFVKYDATTAELNPLIITKTNDTCAAGAVLTIDDDALDRHRELAIDPQERIHDDIEREAARLEIPYVRLGGDIGVIGSGAGLAMATVDLIKYYGGEPANFLDTGGRITREHVCKCLGIVMKNPRVESVLVNMYGGVNPIVEGARGIVEFIEKRGLSIPLVVKVRGNYEEEAWEILERAGISVVKATQTEEAVNLVVELSRKRFDGHSDQ